MSEEKLSVFPMGEKMMPMPGICGAELFEDADNRRSGYWQCYF